MFTFLRKTLKILPPPHLYKKSIFKYNFVKINTFSKMSKINNNFYKVDGIFTNNNKKYKYKTIAKKLMTNCKTNCNNNNTSNKVSNNVSNNTSKNDIEEEYVLIDQKKEVELKVEFEDDFEILFNSILPGLTEKRLMFSELPTSPQPSIKTENNFGLVMNDNFMNQINNKNQQKKLIIPERVSSFID